MISASRAVSSLAPRLDEAQVVVLFRELMRELEVLFAQEPEMRRRLAEIYSRLELRR